MSLSTCHWGRTVRPPQSGDAPNVHGVQEDELREGPSFNVAFRRLYRFCQNISEMAVCADDSSEDECSETILKDTPPEILIVAHNGIGIITHRGYKYGLAENGCEFKRQICYKP